MGDEPALPVTEATPELVQVGLVGRPHGIDGAFVVERGSDDDARYAVGSTLYLDGLPAEVVLFRKVGRGRRAILLDRKADRGQALAVPRSSLPPTGPDAFYAFQLAGLEVELDGEVVGRVREVAPGAANDNLELDDGRLVPLIEDAIAKVDLDSGRIVLNSGFIA
jgi:16S rRNA processing protein RimM